MLLFCTHVFTCILWSRSISTNMHQNKIIHTTIFIIIFSAIHSFTRIEITTHIHIVMAKNSWLLCLLWVLPFGDSVESAPALQLSLCSQVAKFGHHLQAGHVQVGQRPGRLGGRGWCSLERFPSRPPWFESNLGDGRDGSAVEST